MNQSGRLCRALHSKAADLPYKVVVHTGHSVNEHNGDDDHKGGHEQFCEDVIAGVQPDQRDSKRADKKEGYYDGGGGTIPFFRLFRGFIEEFAAVAALDGFGLYFLCAEWAFFSHFGLGGVFLGNGLHFSFLSTYTHKGYIKVYRRYETTD
jgi:hypothetical protein